MLVSTVRKYIEIFILFVCVFSVYSTFLVKIHTTYGQDVFDFVHWAENSIIFPEINDYGEYWRCSRHIAATCAGYLFYKLWILLGWEKGAMIPLQIMSALFGAGGVIIFYCVIKELFKDKKFCLIGSCFFAFSYAYWFFSTEPLQGMPSLFFRLASILLLLKICHSRLRISLLMGLVYGISILFDSQGFLFLPVMIYGIYLFCRKKQKNILFKAILSYLGVIFAVTGITYFCIAYFYFGYNSFTAFLEFAKGGFQHFRINGKSLQDGLYSLFQSLTILDNTYLKNYNIPHLIMGGLFFSSFLGALVYLVKIKSKMSKKNFNIFLLSVTWIFIFFPIYCLKEAKCLDFYIYLSFPIWFIFITALWQIKERLRSNVKKLAIFNKAIEGLLIMLIGNNLIYGIMPLCDYKNDERYEQFMFLKQHYNDEKVLILLTSKYNYFYQNIRYLNQLTGNNVKIMLRANYRVQGDPDYYRQLSMLAGKKESVLLLFSPVVFKEQRKEIKVSDIIAKMEKDPEGTHSYLVRDLLDDLSKEYKFVPVISSSQLECSIISLTKKHDK